MYLLAVAAILIIRSGGDSTWRLPFGSKTGSSSLGTGTLPISGLDVAPDLIRELTTDYGQEYPEQHIDLQKGGTNQALEALINHQSEVAFQLRPPSPAEQALFRKVDGDTVLWYPIALGALVLVQAEGTTRDPVSIAELRSFIMEGKNAGFEHLYVPDPNLGVWDAFLDLLRIPRGQEPDVDRIVFLKDEAQTLKAVREDAQGIAVLTSFMPAGATGVDSLAVESETGHALPTRDAILTGKYPFYHYVYASCRKNGSAQAAMFLTYLTSNRGQRHVERAGFLPTREIQRLIYVTRNPIGRTS